MRRITKVGFQVRDFADSRIAMVRSGASWDPFRDVFMLRVVVASLVEAGLVEESDWTFPGVSLSARGSAIDAMLPSCRGRIEARILSVGGLFKAIDQKVLLTFVPAIVDLVVEMAGVVLVQDRMLASLAAWAHRRPRAGNSVPYDPVELLARSFLHSDPEGFLRDAKARLEAARVDVSKAQRRLSYADRERTSAKPQEVPASVSLDSPSSLSSISVIRGATDDLLRSVAPVVLPSPDPRRRRR